MKRVGSVVGLKDEKLEEYVRMHAEVWPGVLEMIKECNICNYSIFLLSELVRCIKLAKHYGVIDKLK